MKFDLGRGKEIGDIVLSIVVLSTTTESLNIFHKILTEISALKNMKVKIQILDIIFDKFLLIRYISLNSLDTQLWFGIYYGNLQA